MNRIPIYIPYLKGYKASAIDAINSEWVSNYGKYVTLSEQKLEQLLGVKHCILMNNGTSATQCLYVALKLIYPNIERIYISNGVFIAPWNTGLLQYPLETFRVMKTDIQSLNIDTSVEYIKSLETNSAMVVVHNYGNIVDVPRLKRLRPDIIFLEDNCEGLFGKYGDVYSGTESLCSSCSFYGNKSITTGEGGAFFTNDTEIYKYMKSYYSHGMTPERYIHDKIAVNYRMTNVQAALLYDQLNDLDNILNRKKDIITKYNIAFKDISYIHSLKIENNTVPSNWMYVAIIDSDFNKLERFMNVKNIDVRPLFYDIHDHKHLVDVKKDINEHINVQGVMLPSYPGLLEHEQNYIIECVKEYFA